MELKKFKYDVAFSLLSQDEGLAGEINDLLCDRYQTFLYSEKQKEVAGTDGELRFKAVFAEEARFVVVLYRKGWGETPWTRMEEEAIRGRAYEESYDFVKFIPLDKKQTAPKYLPKVQLWINALRFGTKGAASIIEARLAELGAVTSVESPVNRAMRLKRALDFEQKSKDFLRSHEGVNLSNKSFAAIAAALETKAAEITETGINLVIKKQDRVVIVLGLNKGLRIQWTYSYANSLEGAHLDIEVWDGHPPFPGIMSYEAPHKMHSQVFTFELLTNEIGGWMNRQRDSSYDADRLADLALHFYMDNGS
jgi:hypothetical protein